MKQFLLKWIILATALTALNAAFAQSGFITGKVTDSDGTPITGASVVYEGTSVGASTDAKGEYRIKSQPGKTLVVSFFGMKSRTFVIGAQTRLDIKLATDNIKIDDVVVIGYGEVSRKDLTGALSSVSSDDIQKTGSSNVLGALQGRVAGINITSQSGEPGSGFSIKVRGNNSINAGTTPLFVIDGNQIDVSSSEVATSSSTGTGTYDPMSFINPADIESIEVLKDASATAIYGARGANGVVLITTKSGSSTDGRTIVNFDATFGVSSVPKYIAMLSPQQYIDYRFNRHDYGWDSYGEDTDGDGTPDMSLNANAYDQYDWQKLLYRTALTQNYNLSVTGSINKKTQILASIGYLNEEGLITNNDFQRYTGRLKLDHQIAKNVKAGASVTYGRNISNGAVASGGGELSSSGLIQLIYLERPLRVYSEADTDYPNGWTSLSSMVSDETYRKTVYDRIMGNAYMNWDITDHLRMSLNASGNTSNSKLTEFYSSMSRWGQSKNGYGSQTHVNTYSYNASATLTYKRDWNKVHHFDAMVGVEMSKYFNDRLKIGAYNFTDQSTGAFDLSKGSILETPSGLPGESTRMSTLGRVNYNYKSKYYLTINMRADGSSKFTAGSRVGYFPSVSLAWRASEESFIKQNAEWLDNLKIRLSAGATGNDRVSTYAALALMTTNYYAENGKEIMGMAPSSSANPKLKWETTYQYNIGMDLGLFGNRVNLTADAYYKDTHDMLYRATLSAQTGFTEQWQNLGRVENRGVEVVLNTHNIETKMFSWGSSLTFDLSRNKVLDIGGISYTSVNISHGMLSNDISRIMAGQPIGVGWGYVFDGNYQLDDFIITDKYGNVLPSEIVTSSNMNNYKYQLKEGVTKINSSSPLPGDRKYKDLDGDKEITTADKTIISNSNPKFTFGFNNSFVIGNFDVNIFFEGVYGRDIMNEFKLRSESGQSGSTQYNNLRREAWEGHWTPENGSNTYARLLNQTNTWVSSYFVEDGSYIRFKTLSLGYTLNNQWLKRIGLQTVRVSVSADNLYVWTSYSGMDPDVSSSNSLFTGFDRMSYPKARTISLGINATF